MSDWACSQMYWFACRALSLLMRESSETERISSRPDATATLSLSGRTLSGCLASTRIIGHVPRKSTSSRQIRAFPYGARRVLKLYCCPKRKIFKQRLQLALLPVFELAFCLFAPCTLAYSSNLGCRAHLQGAL